MDQIHATTDEDVEKLLITTEAYWSAQLFSLFPYSLIGGKNSIPKSASIIKKITSSPSCKFLVFLFLILSF